MYKSMKNKSFQKMVYPPKYERYKKKHILFKFDRQLYLYQHNFTVYETQRTPQVCYCILFTKKHIYVQHHFLFTAKYCGIFDYNTGNIGFNFARFIMYILCSILMSKLCIRLCAYLSSNNISSS